MIDEKWGTFALVTVLLSYPYCHAILVAWTSKNSNNVGTRSVSAALYNVGFFFFFPIFIFYFRSLPFRDNALHKLRSSATC